MFSSIKTITVRSRLLTASLCFPQWRIIILLSSSYFVLVKSLNGAVSLVRDFPAVFSDVTFCLVFFFIRNTHTCFETRIQNADSNTSLEGYDMKKRDYLKTKEKKKKT